MIRKRLPSPALVIALLALFVALSGTAVAAGIVPLAKRALVSDNAKKLNGATLKDIAGGTAEQAPASVTVRRRAWCRNAGGGTDSSLACRAERRRSRVASTQPQGTPPRSTHGRAPTRRHGRSSSGTSPTAPELPEPSTPCAWRSEPPSSPCG